MVDKSTRQSRSSRVVVRFNVLLKQKSRRDGRPISLREVEAATGIGASTLVGWNTGRVSRFDADKIVALCDYFGCRLSQLIHIVPPE